MKKKIIRNKIAPCLSSPILLSDVREVQHSLSQDEIQRILFTVFSEECEFSQLMQEYKRLLDGNNTEYFSVMYVLDSDVGAVLDSHIYLYHWDKELEEYQHQLVPWIYPDSKKYIGDTWYFDDEEILGDLKTMSVIDLLKKYKGF